jgi:hypothetical protein
MSMCAMGWKPLWREKLTSFAITLLERLDGPTFFCFGFRVIGGRCSLRRVEITKDDKHPKRLLRNLLIKCYQKYAGLASDF